MEYTTEAAWRAVAEMEQDFYTKQEIAEALREVADNVDFERRDDEIFGEL